MHVTAIEILWSRLRDIGENIPESQVISKILSTLPSSYRHFYTTWNNSPDQGKTVKLLLSKLQEEEAISDLSDLNSGGVPAHDGAFTSHHFRRPQNVNRPYAHQSERPAPYLVPYRGG